MENKELRKELKVTAIENGTVIDHIPANNLFKVVKILDFAGIENQILFATNLDSKKYGKKGIIKISDKFFKVKEINRIALVAPTATIIEIKDFKVVKKKNVHVPDEVFNTNKCVNPNCITNHQNIPSRFQVINKEDLKLRCHYCEKITDKDNLIFL